MNTFLHIQHIDHDLIGVAAVDYSVLMVHHLELSHYAGEVDWGLPPYHTHHHQDSV